MFVVYYILYLTTLSSMYPIVHPTGIGPVFPASEAGVLSIRLRVHINYAVKYAKIIAETTVINSPATWCLRRRSRLKMIPSKAASTI